MMKKMLALLLALLLPAAAMAEASHLVLTLTVNEENCAEYFKSTGVFAGEDREEELCAALVRFMNGMGVTVTTQEDAFRIDMQMAGKPLLDLSVLTSGSDYILTSTLMGDVGITIPQAAFSAEDDAFISRLAQTDWVELLGGMFAAGAQTLASVEHTAVRGSFAGDAFSGGVYCDTYIFDDAQVSAFVDALLTEDFRSLLLFTADYWEFDGVALLSSIEAKNEQVAAANEHRYIVRFVYGAKNELIGVSATILKGQEQLATLSVGFELNQVKLVLGFGLDDVNYWHSQTVSFVEKKDEDGVTTYSLMGAMKEFTAPKEYAFSRAEYDMTELRMKTVWSADLMVQSGGLSWKYVNSQQMGEDAPAYSTDAQGLYIPGVRLINTSTSSVDGKEIVTEKILWAPCDPISTDSSELTLVDMTADEEAIQDLGLSIGMELAQRLIDIIPMELLFYFQ